MIFSRSRRLSIRKKPLETRRSTLIDTILIKYRVVPQVGRESRQGQHRFFPVSLRAYLSYNTRNHRLQSSSLMARAFVVQALQGQRPAPRRTLHPTTALCSASSSLPVSHEERTQCFQKYRLRTANHTRQTERTARKSVIMASPLCGAHHKLSPITGGQDV
ncbi:hypothetical protein BP00DRAFT_29869 [Aspergillus indologenus CBS 114.80]|uniref:Uncharacterized protein n=1 Tax=Aspergillus indologenus CBS 114.80 TaxID=1450541 RepID=A0A2V5HSD1_9EURO|nr:hypothetical protein BP00DRAFT_29869 [Aspergillus indologenus CBS 114.80]